jgi:hypothetical protein
VWTVGHRELLFLRHCNPNTKKIHSSLFVWLVADGLCWFVLREKYCWLVAGGWFVLREKYYWLVDDKPSEQDTKSYIFHFSHHHISTFFLIPMFYRSVRLAYQPPTSSIFLSEQISHQQPASSNFLLEQISTSHQSPAKRTGCIFPYVKYTLSSDRMFYLLPPPYQIISRFGFSRFIDIIIHPDIMYI